MGDFERDSVYSREKEINSIHEAEQVIDKVLSTGHNFYPKQTIEYHETGVDHNYGHNRNLNTIQTGLNDDLARSARSGMQRVSKVIQNLDN